MYQNKQTQPKGSMPNNINMERMRYLELATESHADDRMNHCLIAIKNGSPSHPSFIVPFPLSEPESSGMLHHALQQYMFLIPV